MPLRFTASGRAGRVSLIPPAAASSFTNTYTVDLNGTNQYLAVDTLAADLTSDTTGTISLFVKPDTIATSSTDCLVVIGNGSNSYVQVSQYDGDIFVNTSVAGSNKYTLRTDDAVLSTSTFKHVMVTHDGVRPRIYIDNVEVASTFTVDVDRTAWLADFSANKFRIGQNPTAGGVNWFGGLVDELVVLRTAATSEQRTALYGEGVATDVSSLSPYTWLRMGDNDGGTGTTITDQGSGGNDATLTNGPTFSTDVPT
jgi:hypothetical protein